jgi:type II secretory pathway pseudopilin PulG
MIYPKNKKAFSMVTAIFVIIIMATVTALIMNVTGKTIKATTQQFQKEQAGLLARSYTELAILYAIHYDRSGGTCLEKITDTFGAKSGFQGYAVEVDIKYIGNDDLLATCNNNIEHDGTINLANKNATWSNKITGFDKTISLIIDTHITYKDFDDPQDRNITFYRRTLQKL